MDCAIALETETHPVNPDACVLYDLLHPVVTVHPHWDKGTFERVLCQNERVDYWYWRTPTQNPSNWTALLRVLHCAADILPDIPVAEQ